MAPGFARTVVQLAQGATQGFNFAFVGQLLAFRQLHQFQHFLHLIHGALQGVHNFHHLVNRLADGGAAVLRFGAGYTFGQALDAFQQGPVFEGAARGNGLWFNGGFPRRLGAGNGCGRRHHFSGCG
jgi:hypothetical protein